MEIPEGKKFYGSVTVSERGQIVIPADARKDFNIQVGDKILVFGELGAGFWVTTLPIIQKYAAGSAHFANFVQTQITGKMTLKRQGQRRPGNKPPSEAGA